MKITIGLAVAVLAVGGTIAQAQRMTPAVSVSTQTATPMSSPFSYSPYAYPFGYDHASTVQEGYARGIGDIIRSQGEYNLNTSVAAINFSQARIQEIENAKKWTEAYFDIRNYNKQQYDAEQKRRRGTAEDWIRLAQLGMPKRLSPSELDSVTGELHWPLLLTTPEYSVNRIEVEKAFADRAYHGVLEAEAYLKISHLIEGMLSSLKAKIRDLPASQYVAATRFLESLAYESSQPAG
jgi:hypothetical protein